MTVNELIKQLAQESYEEPVVIRVDGNYVEISDVTVLHGTYETETGKIVKGKWMVLLDT